VLLPLLAANAIRRADNSSFDRLNRAEDARIRLGYARHIEDRTRGELAPRETRSISLLGFCWRPRRESNPRTRICSPLRSHSATRP
jgi:hypothetical protein